MARASRVKKARTLAAAVTAKLLQLVGYVGYRCETPGLRVTFTRHGITCDDDNLQGAFKAYRDGVADAVGVDDRHTHDGAKTRKFYEFIYKQGPSQRTLKGFDLEIEVRMADQGAA